MGADEQRKIFARNLNHQLERNRQTQKETADLLGVSLSTFNSWCTGQKMPRMDKMELLANHFHIQKSDLIEDKQPEPEEILILNRAARQMSPENRKKLLEMAKLMFQEDFSEDE